MAQGKRTPTAIKKLQGTYKQSRELDKEMEVSDAESTDLTFKLNKYAEAEWLRVTGELTKRKMLKTVDTSLLLAYCIEMGKFFECEDILRNEGYTFTSPKGHIMVRPEKSMSDAALDRAMKLADKFGFNPAARTKISMPDQKQEDDFEAI